MVWKRPRQNKGATRTNTQNNRYDIFLFGLKAKMYTRIYQVWENANDATRMKLYFIIFRFLIHRFNILHFASFFSFISFFISFYSHFIWGVQTSKTKRDSVVCVCVLVREQANKWTGKWMCLPVNERAICHRLYT